MPPESEQPDPLPTKEQLAIIASLTNADILDVDRILLSHARPAWRKVSMLVGLAMTDPYLKTQGLPDIFYAMRVRMLVEAGALESAGDLAFMRFSEVRLPVQSPIEQ
jgi:hypothetical protein